MFLFLLVMASAFLTGGRAVVPTTTHQIATSNDSSPDETYITEASGSQPNSVVTAGAGSLLSSSTESPAFVFTSPKQISSQEQTSSACNGGMNAVHLSSQTNDVSTQEAKTQSVSVDSDPVGCTSFPNAMTQSVTEAAGSSEKQVLGEDATSPPNSIDTEREKNPSIAFPENDTDGVTVHLGGIGIQHCPVWSCLGRCFLNTAVAPASPPNITESEASRCTCDRSCIRLGDCCVDFFSLCLNVTDETEVLAILEQALYDSDNASIVETDREVNATDMIKSYGSCVTDPEGERYTMVTACPGSFTGQHDVVETCEEADKYPSLQPYSDADFMTLTFRNVFCARCHGYEEDKLLPWTRGVSCKKTDASNNFALPGSQSGAESSSRYDFAEVMAAIRSGDCKYVYRPPSNTLTQPRPCFPSTELGGLNDPTLDLSRNGTVSDEKCTFKDMLLCRSYSYQTFTSDNVEVKNPHCLKCQTGFTPVSVDLPCSRTSNSSKGGRDTGSDSGQDRGGILALFSRDMSSGTNSIVVDGHKVSWPGFLCNNDQVFDYVFLVCRTLFCPPGFRAVGGKCSHVDRYFVPGNLQMMPEGTKTVYVTVGMTHYASCQNQLSTIQKTVDGTFENAYRRQMKDMPVDTFPSLHFSCVRFDGEEGANSSQAQRSSLQVAVYPVSNLSTTLDALLDVVRERFEDYIASGSVKITNYEAEPQVECTVGNPEFMDHANISSIEGELYVERSEYTVASFYPLTNVVFRIDLAKSNETDSTGSFREVSSVYITMLCVQPRINSTLNCSSVPFEINRTRVENGTLFIAGTDLSYPLSEYELHEQFALVCSDFKNLNALWNSIRFFEFSDAQFYVSWAFSLTSVLCLLTSLVAFCFVPHLQTLAGRMTASLAGSLASGQLLILVDFIHHRVVCSVFAAVSHFCWLAAFSWMTALAVHMSRTFYGSMAANAGQHNTRHVRKEYRKYGLVCWGLPALLVILCFILDTVTGTGLKVGYGSPLCGWMQYIYVFLVPAALALAINVVCFLLTLISIERTIRASHAATLTRQQNSDKQRLVVYSKMVGIMGFTWAAGFLAAFTEVAAFWWVYIVLNGLQGTFIAFSFVLNARLLRFLKNKMSNTNAASGIDSKSRTQGTEWRIGPASAQQLAGERQHVHIGGISFRPSSDCGALGACLDRQKGDPDASLSGLSGTSITVETNVDI